MTRTTKAEQAEAIERLKVWLKPGDTVHCVCNTNGYKRNTKQPKEA